jgi:PPM family protein phosphatase
LRAHVRMSYEGLVYKTFRGPNAAGRFENEVKVLKYLQDRGCLFIPPLVSYDPRKLQIVMRSCGNRVDHLDKERAERLFTELEAYGVRHDDQDVRNVTYRQSDGRFCIIDFEFATILDEAAAREVLPGLAGTIKAEYRESDADEGAPKL